nr:ankyrin repeat domain-containing protein [Brevibacillus dissolubilis]
MRNQKQSLYDALQRGETGTLIDWLNQGNDPHQYVEHGCPLLFIATHFNNVQAVTILLAAGVDPDKANDLGITPLIHAAYLNFKEIVRLLLPHCKNIDATESHFGHTALIEAVRAGNKEMMMLLLQYGGKIDIQTHEGKTAMEIAVSRGYQGIAAILSDAMNR